MSNTLHNIPIPVELLGLSDVEVKALKTNEQYEVIITVNSTREIVPCRICKKPTSPHGIGRPLKIRHLPLFGMATYIEITPRRGLCTFCDDKPSTTEQLDWYDSKSQYTKAYEQHLLFELINSTVADVSVKENVEYHSIEKLLDKYIEQAINFDDINFIDILGIDEISIKKGYRDFVTLITYRHEGKVRLLTILPGRKQATVKAFLMRVPERLKKTINGLCCDLYDGFIEAAKAAFKEDVPVIADRFHVTKLYRKKLVTVRKAELKRLKKKLSKQEYKNLQPAITMLRKQKDYFTDDERQIVEPLFKLSPKLHLAYQYSHKLTTIFNSHFSKAEAKEKLIAWINDVSHSELNCFNTFIKTLNKYIDEISNYFISRKNSGFVEGFNNRVKVMKRRCYGIATIGRLFQRIILDTLGFERFAPRMAYC